MRKVLVLREDYYGYDHEYDMEDCLLYSKTFEVDLGNLEGFKVENDHEYRYVAAIVEEAESSYDRGGVDENKAYSLSSHSRKFSFGDCADWYSPLKPSADEPVEKRFFYYEVR